MGKELGVGEAPDLLKKRIAVDPTPLQIRDIAEARAFYQELLGCLEEARGDERLDFTLYGHPIICRLNSRLGKQGRVASHYHLVDARYVPTAHCRIVLEMRQWRSLAKRLRQHRVKFVIESYRRMTSAPGVQATLLLRDPCGNALEIQSSRKGAKEFPGRERQTAFARRMPWAILTAFIVCCILLLLNKARG
jgi:extradiol dioxygenase family protein